MPTVIGVCEIVINSIRALAWILISRLSLEPGATGSSTMPTCLISVMYYLP